MPVGALKWARTKRELPLVWFQPQRSPGDISKTDMIRRILQVFKPGHFSGALHGWEGALAFLDLRLGETGLTVRPETERRNPGFSLRDRMRKTSLVGRKLS